MDEWEREESGCHPLLPGNQKIGGIAEADRKEREMRDHP